MNIQLHCIHQDEMNGKFCLLDKNRWNSLWEHVYNGISLWKYSTVCRNLAENIRRANKEKTNDSIIPDMKWRKNKTEKDIFIFISMEAFPFSQRVFFLFAAHKKFELYCIAFNRLFAGENVLSSVCVLVRYFSYDYFIIVIYLSFVFRYCFVARTTR